MRDKPYEVPYHNQQVDECKTTAARVSVRERLELNQARNNERISQLEKQNKAIKQSLSLLNQNKNLEQLAELFSVIGNNQY